MPDDATKKPSAPNPERSENVKELPDQEIAERDAQAVKGGAFNAFKHKK